MDLIQSGEKKQRVFKLGLTLTPAQQKIDEDPARFKIVRAGRKFGKTTFSQKWALDMLRVPNSNHWHIAPTYRQAKLISWEEFKRLIPAEALGKKPNDQDLMITLKNGSRLHLMGSDDPDALRGPSPTSATFEEAAFQKREVWHEIMRPNLMPRKSPVLFIGTPKGYNWFYDLEQEARRSVAAGEGKWAIFHYTVYNNPHIDAAEIADAKRSCDSDAVWRQEYMAEYESSVGRVFAAFNEDRHVGSVDRPVGDVFRSVDWGMRDDTACLWGYVRNRKLYIYREYSDNNLSAPAQAEIVKGLTGTEKVVRTAISHDAAKEDPAMKGLTVMWHFQNAGITPLRPSSRDKKHSRSMIQELLRQDRLVMDRDKCPKLRKQLFAYEWKDTTMEKPDESVKQDLVDALHYLVEMLQFDLFLGGKIEVKTSLSELISQHEKKVAEYHNFPLVNAMEDSFSPKGAAGYFR